MGVVDALLDADETTLRAALDALRDARGRALSAEPERLAERERLLGWLEGMIAVAHWALERITPESTLAAVARVVRRTASCRRSSAPRTSRALSCGSCSTRTRLR